ncbi:MAG TPA: type II toxin-antitoxin system VapC family toxin [Lacisediminihabitans sp.]|uniref:type II toxin-antitoxin system VapC family toxin n=1 Tax=Lacisediminihabitans sp. TaxID=2787631 RepID=UPI002EDA04EC
MRIYVDSSALIKRSIDEPESEAIESSLEGYAAADAVLISSTLAWIELGRGIRSRLDAEDPAAIVEWTDAALSGIAEAPITEQVASLARRIGPPVLRSLDAIHLATAVLLDVDLILAYDDRLLAAATELGFAVVSRAGAGPWSRAGALPKLGG